MLKPEKKADLIFKSSQNERVNISKLIGLCLNGQTLCELSQHNFKKNRLLRNRLAVLKCQVHGVGVFHSIVKLKVKTVHGRDAYAG